MGILKSLSNFFSKQPYTVAASLTSNGVQITVKRGDKSIARKELSSQKKNLPPALWDFINQNGHEETITYQVSLPVARSLATQLTDHQSDKFIVEMQTIERLNASPCPQEFYVHWHLDTSSQALTRTLIASEGYLGDGWFYYDTNVWQLPLHSEMLAWMSKTRIASNELYDFLSNGIEKHRSSQFRCDLSIEPNFEIKLTVVKMLKQSLEVQITSNMPALQAALTTIKNDKRHLLSGNRLIPEQGQYLRGRLLELVRLGRVTRIQGDELLAFIQDEFVPAAHILGMDSTAILTEAYPIYDAAKLPSKWKLEYKFLGGIGSYNAVPCISLDSDLIPVEKLETSIDKRKRFYQVEGGWLELTPEFRTRYVEWKQRNLRTLEILPQEIMGSSPERLTTLGLHPPQIDIPDAITESEQVRTLIRTMQQHGLPVGFYGLQQEAGDIIAEACQSLLKAHKNARILWLVTRSKKDEAVKALKKAQLLITERPEKLEGRVLLTTPDNVTLPVGLEWSLIIFSDVDVLVAGEKQSRAYQAVRRVWTICTFTRPDWHKNIQHRQRILRALRLGDEDLKHFLQICTGVYSDQSKSLIARLTSPFKKIFAGDTDETKPTGGVPIPPRQSSTPSPLRDTGNVYRPNFTVSVSSSPGENRFLSKAKKLVNHTEPATDPVPFMQYWATYDSMNAAQRKWYFYWRSQVRLGNYLPADLSYLFIHIYEVIHLVGFENAQQAFNYLETFWKQYRLLHPKLDRYLIDWLADFQIVYNLSDTALLWYVRVQELGGRIGDLDTALEVWLASNTSIEQIPTTLLKMLSDYDPTKSKFYQQHNTDGSVENDLKRSLYIVDGYIRQKEGKSFFEKYRPLEKQMLIRQPFASAVYEGKRETITVATLSKWSQSGQLKTAITSIIKYTENLLRRQRAFKGTLRGVDLASDWAAILDAAFPLPVVEVSPKKQRGKAVEVVPQTPVVDTPLTIDFGKVSALRQESDEVRQRLTVEDEESIVEAAPSPAVPELMVPAATVSSFNLERPADTPEHLLTDLRGIAETIAGDKTAIHLLRYLRSQQWESNEEAAQTAVGGEFLSVVLDRINGRAIERIGDNLIFAEGNQLVIAEDYRDELDYLLPQTVESITATAEHEVVALAENYENLNEEWAAFVHQMQSHHWEALNALIIGEDVELRLDGIARSVYTTMDLLVDELNEFALESIGDIIIETGSSPRIEDEDIDSLRSLLEWALTNIQQE